MIDPLPPGYSQVIPHTTPIASTSTCPPPVHTSIHLHTDHRTYPGGYDSLRTALPAKGHAYPAFKASQAQTLGVAHGGIGLVVMVTWGGALYMEQRMGEYEVRLTLTCTGIWSGIFVSTLVDCLCALV